MYCPKCGKQISDDSKFCPYCGAKITVDVKEPTKQSFSYQSTSQSQSAQSSPVNVNYFTGSNRVTLKHPISGIVKTAPLRILMNYAIFWWLRPTF